MRALLRRHRLKLLGVGWLVVSGIVLLVAVFLAGGHPHRPYYRKGNWSREKWISWNPVTRENYAKLRIGMAYHEVEAILDGPDRAEAGPIPMIPPVEKGQDYYCWLSRISHGSIEIIVDGGQVVWMRFDE